MKFASAIFKTFVLSVLMVAQVHYAYADTASILPPAKTTFLDQNGKPLTGGKVDFYIPGTTTRKTTWQDSGETIPNANPVTLDAAGRAIILGSGSYRQVVKDKNGNVIWDQVTASPSSGSSGSTGDNNAVGTIIAFSGSVPPNNYLFAYGQAISRATYSTYFTVSTIATTATCVSGSPTLNSIPDTSQIGIGSAVESACLPINTTVVSKTSSTVTLNNNAIVSTTVSTTFFPFGNGDGVATFNIPDLRGKEIVGRCNMGGANCSVLTSTYFGADPNGYGVNGGSQSTTLVGANLPPYTPSGTITNGAISSAASGGFIGGNNFITTAQGTGGGANVPVNGNTIIVTSLQAASTFTGTAQGGTSVAFSRIQPSMTLNYIVKVLPDSGGGGGGGAVSSVAAGDASLNVAPNTGNVLASINLANPNVWTGVQTFPNGSIPNATLVSPSISINATTCTLGASCVIPAGGTVTSVSVASANGLSGSVVNPTTTPTISLSTTATGVLKGNGTAISAATAGTDYQAPITLTTTGTSGAATFSGNILNIPQYTGGGGGAGTAFKQDYIAGSDFTSGVTTSLTLTTTPSSQAALLIYFDGVFQSNNTWSLATNVITFSSPITATHVVEAVGLGPATGGGTGTVTSFSIVNANGFSGSVANSTTTPALTLTTTVTGMLKGNGTAISAATAGTDYQAPITLTTTGTSGAATFSGGVLNIPNYSTGGSPGGLNTYLQFNSSGTFGGSSLATFDGTGINAAIGTSVAKSGSFTTVGATGHMTASGLQTTPTGSIGSALCLDTSNNIIKNAGADCFTASGGAAPFVDAVGVCGVDNAHGTTLTASANTTAIQNCISTYTSVAFRKGLYLVDCTANAGLGIIINTNNVAIFGIGSQAHNGQVGEDNSTTFYCSNSTGNIFTRGTSSETIWISGLVLDRGTYTTGGGFPAISALGSVTSGAGIGYTGNLIDILGTMKDIMVQNQYNGIVLPPSSYGNIENITAQNNFNDGLLFQSNGLLGSFQQNLVNILSQANNGYGFHVVNATTQYGTVGQWTNTGTFANGAGGYYFQATGGGSSSVNDVRLTNINASGDNNSCINFNTNGEHNQVIGGLIEGCGTGSGAGHAPVGRNGSVSASLAGHGVLANGNNTEVLVSNVAIRAPAQSNVYATSGTGRLIITGTTLSLPNQISGGNQAIVVAGTSTYGAITGNVVIDIVTVAALLSNSGASFLTATGNVFGGGGCGGAAFVKSGNIGTGC